ncbi:MAG: 50S ribosomal protein L10 [Planctomycetota bacterium]|jgi:large subunit ribosomal protein L10
MPNRVNTLMLKELEERYRDADYIIAVGFDGLSGDDTYALRGEFAEKDLSMRVVKNRITELAFKNLEVEGIGSILNGATGLVTGTDPVAMARTIKDFAKSHQALTFRGAVIEGEILDESRAKGLADMASREELLGQVAGAGFTVGGNVSSAITSQGGRIAGCIATLIENLEKESA